jgi:hypothetical protein
MEEPVTPQDGLSAWAKVRAKVLTPQERSEIGAVLLSLGFLLIVARLIFEINAGVFLSGPSMTGFALQPEELDLNPPSFVGTIVVGMGVVLITAGWLAVRPWKRDQY